MALAQLCSRSASSALLIRSACLLALTSILSSCADSSIKPIQPLVEVRAGYLPMVSSLTLFVATEKGFFRENNIKIVPNGIVNSNSIAEELRKGSIDLAVELSIIPLLKTPGNKLPYFKIFSISNIESDNAFDGILVPRDSKLTSFESLSGKRIATFPGTTSPKSIASVFSSKYPAKEKPIMERGIGLRDQLASLMRGEIDAIHAYEPMYTLGKVKYNMRDVSGSIFALQTYPRPNPIGVAALNSKFINDNPAAAKNVINAIDKAVIYIRENEDEARQILSKYTKTEKKIASKMRILPMSTSSEIDIGNLQQYLDLLKTIDENNSSLKARQMIFSN